MSGKLVFLAGNNVWEREKRFGGAIVVVWAGLALIAQIHAEPPGLTAAVVERRSACECREEVGIEVFTLVLISVMAICI